MNYSANDVKIPVIENKVQLWFVRGLDGYCYPTKDAAETAAWMGFGKDTYGRVHFQYFTVEGA